MTSRTRLCPSLVILCWLLFVPLDTLRAQTVRANTWSATSSTGLTLMGTWTAVPNPAPGTAMGTWTLVDASGKTLARGGWSAAKSPKGWSGSWRAAVDRSKTEYAGSWSADLDLDDGTFVDLFARAAEKIVSGAWRAGGRSGAWSIRAFK